MTEARGAATFRTFPDAYDRHVGRYSSELAAALISASGLQPGQRALDVGCGPGALTAALSGLLGGERVAAVDPSEPFAEACASRVAGVRVEVAAAEALPTERRARLRDELRRRLDVGKGPFRLTARAWCVVGRHEHLE